MKLAQELEVLFTAEQIAARVRQHLRCQGSLRTQCRGWFRMSQHQVRIACDAPH